MVAIGMAPPIDPGGIVTTAADFVIGTAWWATGPLRAVVRRGVRVGVGLAGATVRSRRMQPFVLARTGEAPVTLDALIQAVLCLIIKAGSSCAGLMKFWTLRRSCSSMSISTAWRRLLTSTASWRRLTSTPQ